MQVFLMIYFWSVFLNNALQFQTDFNLALRILFLERYSVILWSFGSSKNCSSVNHKQSREKCRLNKGSHSSNGGT